MSVEIVWKRTKTNNVLIVTLIIQQNTYSRKKCLSNVESAFCSQKKIARVRPNQSNTMRGLHKAAQQDSVLLQTETELCCGRLTEN